MNVFSDADLLAYRSVYGTPDYVKSAQVIDSDDLDKLPSCAFADVARKLPTHTKEACWLSALTHYYVKGASDKFIESGLAKAAAVHGISNDVDAIRAAGHEKAAKVDGLTADDYAISRPGENVYRLPIRSLEQLVKSANKLQQEADSYPYLWRKAAARRILSRFSALQETPVNVEYLEKAAGFGVTTPDVLLTALEHRKHAASHPRAKQALDSAAKTLGTRFDKSRPLPMDALFKTAEVMDFCDRLSGLTRYYGRDLPLPEEVCFATTRNKMASIRKRHILAGGYSIEREKLAGVKPERFALLGTRFMDHVRSPSGGTDPDVFEKVASAMPDRLVEAAIRALPFV